MGKYEPAKTKLRASESKRDLCIANIDEIAPESYERPGIAGTSWDLGEATGAQAVGVDITEIPPGKNSSHLHAHSHKEEFFYVLSGRCRVRLGDKVHELRPGDAISRPAGTGVGHQFSNPYAEPCRVLMLGIPTGKGVEDTVEWPELGRAMIVDQDGTRKIVKRG